MPVHRMASLLSPKYFKMVDQHDANLQCPVKTLAFVPDFVEDKNLHHFLPPRPCTCGGATSPTVFLAFSYVWNTMTWKNESDRLAKFFIREKWSKDFGGWWMLTEAPIHAVINKMANIISHTRVAVSA